MILSPLNPKPDMDFDNIEKLLERLAQKANPSVEFESRLLSRLRSRWNALQERKELQKPENGGNGGFVWSSLFSFLKKKAFGAIVALFLVVSTGGISTYAYTSDGVTRESIFYPVKRALEKIQRTITVSTPEDEIDYRVRMMERRLAEVRHLSEKIPTESAKPAISSDASILSGQFPRESGALSATLQEFSEEFDRSIQIVTVIPEDEDRRKFFDRFEKIVQKNESFFPRRFVPSLIHEISTDKKPDVFPNALPDAAKEAMPPVSSVPREIHRRLEQAEESLRLQKQIDRQIRTEVRQELNRFVQSKVKSGEINRIRIPLPKAMSPEPPPTAEPKPAPELEPAAESKPVFELKSKNERRNEDERRRKK